MQTGEGRSRDIELSAVGKLTNNLSIITAYVYQDVKNVKANDYTTEQVAGRYSSPTADGVALGGLDVAHRRARGSGVRRGRALSKLSGGRGGQLHHGTELYALRCHRAL